MVFRRVLPILALIVSLAGPLAWAAPSCETGFFELGLENTVHYSPLPLREIKRLRLRPKLPTIDLDPAGRERAIDPRSIHFMQGDCKNSNQDGTHTVLETALDLRTGKVKVTDLPAIRVWRDREGRIWTLDHRRLAAFRLAGIDEPIPVLWADPGTVRAERNKMSNRDEGRSILLKLGGDRAIGIR